MVDPQGAVILSPKTMPLVCGDEISACFNCEEGNQKVGACDPGGMKLRSLPSLSTSRPLLHRAWHCSLSERGIPPPELPSAKTLESFVYSLHRDISLQS